MQLDWDKAINEILSDKMTCQACGALDDEMVVGYTREASAAEFHATSVVTGAGGLTRISSGV